MGRLSKMYIYHKLLPDKKQGIIKERCNWIFFYFFLIKICKMQWLIKHDLIFACSLHFAYDVIFTIYKITTCITKPKSHIFWFHPFWQSSIITFFTKQTHSLLYFYLYLYWPSFLKWPCNSILRKNNKILFSSGYFFAPFLLIFFLSYWNSRFAFCTSSNFIVFWISPNMRFTFLMTVHTCLNFVLT